MARYSTAYADNFKAKWNAASTLDEAAAAVGQTRPTARQTAYMLRKQGVALKDLRRRKRVCMTITGASGVTGRVQFEWQPSDEDLAALRDLIDAVAKLTPEQVKALAKR